jgi:hypothetical protein
MILPRFNVRSGPPGALVGALIEHPAETCLRMAKRCLERTCADRHGEVCGELDLGVSPSSNPRDSYASPCRHSRWLTFPGIPGCGTLQPLLYRDATGRTGDPHELQKDLQSAWSSRPALAARGTRTSELSNELGKPVSSHYLLLEKRTHSNYCVATTIVQ